MSEKCPQRTSLCLGVRRSPMGMLRSLFTLFASVTGGISWKEASDTAASMGLGAYCMYLGYVAFMVFSVLNFVTAMSVDAAIQMGNRARCVREVGRPLSGTRPIRDFRAASVAGFLGGTVMTCVPTSSRCMFARTFVVLFPWHILIPFTCTVKCSSAFRTISLLVIEHCHFPPTLSIGP